MERTEEQKMIAHAVNQIRSAEAAAIRMAIRIVANRHWDEVCTVLDQIREEAS